jgi:hypothetical protein
MMCVFTPTQFKPPKRRPCSIFTQRSMTASRPAAAGLGRGLIIFYTELLPEHLGADGDGVLGDGHHVLRLAEHVDDVDLARDVAQRLVALLAEDLGVFRVHRDHGIAVLLHVLGGEVAGPEPVGGQTDHRDDAVLAQDPAQGVDVVHGGLL